METRDQWYKPNLLYNIHWRPPKDPEAPKMIVETVRFNPSVCTCGEHDCEPRYRMEKTVLWTNKEMSGTILKKANSNEIVERDTRLSQHNSEDDNSKVVCVKDGQDQDINEEGNIGEKKGFIEEDKLSTDGEMKAHDDSNCSSDDREEYSHIESDEDGCGRVYNDGLKNDGHRERRDSCGGSCLCGLEKNCHGESDKDSCGRRDKEGEGGGFTKDSVGKNDVTNGGGCEDEDENVSGYNVGNVVVVGCGGCRNENLQDQKESESYEYYDCEISSAFGILSVYCNSEIHCVIQSFADQTIHDSEQM